MGLTGNSQFENLGNSILNMKYSWKKTIKAVFKFDIFICDFKNKEVLLT
jgi:hypothetical protein